MSRKMTRIRVPGSRNSMAGFLDWGEKSRSEMINIIRAQADFYREAVNEIDATSDDEFEVDVVLGSAVQRHIRRLEP